MNTQVKKKFIITILLFLVVLLIILVVVINYINSKKYMFNLLNKSAEKVNYSSQYEECISYVKGNIEKVVYQNDNIIYYDYDKSECIYIDTQNKEITISALEENFNSYTSKYMADFEEKDYRYKGCEEVNGIQCLVIDLYKEKEEEYLIKRIYINKKCGIIERIAYYNFIDNKEKLLSKDDYTMHTGEVTDQDIMRPDINEYEGYLINDERK